MTDTTEKSQSMDDVLASIRRIVRAEREIDEEGADDAVVVQDDGDDEVVGDAPLALTPEMMSEDEEDEEMFRRPDPPSEEPDPGSRSAELASFVRAPAPLDEEDNAPASTSTGMDADEVRNVVRDVIREELAGGNAEGLVRDIIKAELTTGDIGANISKNVLRLIKSEIAKANG